VETLAEEGSLLPAGYLRDRQSHCTIRRGLAQFCGLRAERVETKFTACRLEEEYTVRKS
jgi:hypothetical protein